MPQRRIDLRKKVVLDMSVLMDVNENTFVELAQHTLPSADVVTNSANSHLLAFFPSSILSQTIPAVMATISNIVLSLTSLVAQVTTFILRISLRLQDVGEILLISLLILSLLQAAVALYQYRYDTRGQLVYPNGPTLGVEDYWVELDCHAKESNAKVMDENMSTIDSMKGDDDTQSECENDEITTAISFSTTMQILRKLNKSLLLLLPWISGNIHNLLTKNTHLFHIGFIVALVRFLENTVLSDNDGSERDGNTGNVVAEGADEEGSRGWNWSILKWMFDTDHVHGVTHTIQNQRDSRDNKVPTLFQKLQDDPNYAHHPFERNDPIRVLVIGDSLAVGIGCLEVFDAHKDNNIPMALIENTDLAMQEQRKPSPSKLQSPVFPKMLARTLSYHFKRPVHWRSAGVDGGDINDIHRFCLNVLKQECSASGSNSSSPYVSGQPDVVVVIFGMNDLKHMMAVNPLQLIKWGKKDGAEKGGGMSYLFRRGMESVISDIQAYAPNAIVVFPQLPIQTFHKNSAVNIVPFGLLFDMMMGIWEGNKKRVAEGKKRSNGSLSKRNTMYVELTAKEIADWYLPSNAEDATNRDDLFIPKEYPSIQDDMLLSADGVHPNKRMYSRWAEYVGHKVYKRIVPQLEMVQQKRKRTVEERVNTRLKELQKKIASQVKK